MPSNLSATSSDAALRFVALDISKSSVMVAAVSVAKPSKVKLLAQTKVKKDTRDAPVLARRMSADLVPLVWVPPLELEVRELRSLVSNGHRLVGQPHSFK